MIADERVAHKIRVHEPQHRKQRADKKERRRRRSAAHSPPAQPERQQCADGGNRREPLSPRTDVELPPWVNETEIGRPDQFANVKPGHSAGEQTSFWEGQDKLYSLCADMVVLQPGCHQAKTNGQPKEWHGR